MTDQRIMPGIDNLQGREFNGIFVERLASRHPVRWQLRCVRCGSNWVEDHARVRYIGCRNSTCGRAPLEPRATLVQTGQAMTAVRSRDSESAREFHRQQTAEPVIRWAAQPSEAGMQNADPSSMRRYLDYVEGR